MFAAVSLVLRLPGRPAICRLRRLVGRPRISAQERQQIRSRHRCRHKEGVVPRAVENDLGRGLPAGQPSADPPTRSAPSTCGDVC